MSANLVIFVPAPIIPKPNNELIAI